MRTGQPIISRPAWYDRNPIPRVDSYEGGSVAPHAPTERLTYTVPAGKKAIVELLLCQVQRVTAATTAACPVAYIQYTPSGQNIKTMLKAHIRGNNAGDKSEAQPAGTFTLFAGDTLSFKTSDGSTGGTVDYDLSYKLTEFDA